MSLISVCRSPAVTLGFSSKRTKSAPPFFLYAFFQSSFACIYCHRRKNVLNMGEGAGLRILGPRVGKGGKLNLTGNRLAGWKPFKHPPPPPRTPPLGRYKKNDFCESMSCRYYNVFARICHICMGYAFNYTDLRATPVRARGVVAKLIKVSKPKVFFNKAEISYFYSSHI